ncbi:hypothetical protein [Corynebacterium glyciniphilum]|nr:hypothetical protein [Corynebacterium glyciniphilum]
MAPPVGVVSPTKFDSCPVIFLTPGEISIFNGDELICAHMTTGT